MSQTQKDITELLYKRHRKMYLGKEATAKELGVGIATLDRMRLDGEIKSSKIRGSVKFALAEIAKFMD